jgi:hypothetical protein
METTVGRVLALLMNVVAAVTSAIAFADIARDDFGLSPENIRIFAVVAAAVIAALMAVEFFGKRLRKPN